MRLAVRRLIQFMQLSETQRDLIQACEERNRLQEKKIARLETKISRMERLLKLDENVIAHQKGTIVGLKMRLMEAHERSVIREDIGCLN